MPKKQQKNIDLPKLTSSGPVQRTHDFFVDLLPFLATMHERLKAKTCLVCGATDLLQTSPNYPEFVFCQKHMARLLASIPVSAPVDLSGYIEPFAAFMHDAWAKWTQHFFSNLTAENISRWQIQAKTSYDDLSEEEKEKDRKFAREILVLFEEVS